MTAATHRPEDPAAVHSSALSAFLAGPARGIAAVESLPAQPSYAPAHTKGGPSDGSVASEDPENIRRRRWGAGATVPSSSPRAPATPSPAKGALVPSRKRPWAVAASSLPSSLPSSRPASPATPEADAGAGARESRAKARARVSRHSKALFPDAPGAFFSASPEPLVRGSSPGKARAVASRQGDIRAMFAAREGPAARATRARAAGAA